VNAQTRERINRCMQAAVQVGIIPHCNYSEHSNSKRNQSLS